MSTVLEAMEWVSLHSDVTHPGSREDCSHCQEMIKTFGPMPSKEELLDAIGKHAALLRLEHGRPSIAKEDRWAIWERDDFRCRTCGSRRYLTIDHVVPLAKGGANVRANYQTLCERCNGQKGAD